jgi:signal transduction histidine kinase
MMANVETARGAAEGAAARSAALLPAETVAGIVHDLGNLIQIASSAVSIVARSPRIRDANLESVISGATISLERAATLVRRGIGVARESVAAPERVSVADCLSEVEALTYIGWGPHVRVEIHTEGNLPDVNCDRLALQNAVLNLVFNARDAMPDGGVIAVRAEAIAFGQAEAVLIHVTDQGVGMTPETMDRALDLFFTTKSDGLGGVGLPMVEHFAREAGGRLLIESEFGAGTTATLQLPSIASARHRALERDIINISGSRSGRSTVSGRQSSSEELKS